MAIAFNTIPVDILTPGVFAEIDGSRAVQGVQAEPHDVLLIGQMLSSGTATAGSIVRVDSEDDAIVLFGAKSQLRGMVGAYKRYDSLTPVYVCPLADNGTTKAVGSIVWTGTATESGELPIYVAGRRFVIPVVSGDTAATIETNGLLQAATISDAPVTITADAAAGLDFEATQAGTAGNQIFLGVALLPGERVPRGLTVTVTAMASGATDPSYASAVTAMADDQYATVVSGLCAATPVGLLVTELESRWGAMRQIPGQLFAAKFDTAANLTTLGNTFNSFAFTLLGGEVSALKCAPWEEAAEAAAISALQAQVDPSRTSTGVLFPGCAAAPRGSRFSRAQRNTILSDGVSTTVAASDGRMQVERFITTYQTNSASIPDRAYQDLTTVRLLSALRFTLRARISTKFARFKLMSDGVAIPPGQPICTPSIIRTELIALFIDWQNLGWVENLDQFKDELLVERDLSDPNRVNIILPPDLINNLLVTAAQIAFKR